MRFEAIDWASVSDDAPTTWLSEHGCGCGGTCGTCTEGTSFWASVAEGPGEWLAEHGVRSPGRRRRVASGTSGGSGTSSGSGDDVVCRDAAGDPVPCCDRSGAEVDCCSEDCWKGLCGQGCEVAGKGAERKDDLPDWIPEWMKDDLESMLDAVASGAYAPEPLVPPAGWTLGDRERALGCKPEDVSCRGRMYGDRYTCTASVSPGALTDLTGADTARFSRFVDVSRLDVGDQEVVSRAWAVLWENRDLIRYAACWVMGATAAAADIVSMLAGEAGTVKFRYDSEVCLGGGRAGVDPRRTHIIAICPVSVGWTSQGEAWARGTTAERACAVFQASCTILHELTHATELVGEDTGDCEESYLVENVYRWAMYQRFADLQDSATSRCCGRSDSLTACMFGSGRGLGITENCV